MTGTPGRPSPATSSERPAARGMSRHEFLRRLHRLSAPGTYLEIGVNDGRSLALSRVPSIAIDPAFKVTVPIRCDVHLVRATSDDFFAGADPLRHLRGGRHPWRNLRAGRPLLGRLRPAPPIDLAFIDGMHLFEYALRDFMNVERHARWSSVIVLDDMLPRNVPEAARDRQTVAWAGDVYKLLPVLARHRPDLVVIPVDTRPTGVVVVLGADPKSDVLQQQYDEIVAEWVVPDPQPVPPEILERRAAVAPDRLLASRLWPDLVRARRLRVPAAAGRRLIEERIAPLRRTTGTVSGATSS